MQISLVYINTLMVQQIFTDETWFERMTPEDFRALTPLTYEHINPYLTHGCQKTGPYQVALTTHHELSCSDSLKE